MSRGKRVARGVGLGCFSLLIIAVCLLFFTELGHTVRDLWRHGIIQAEIGSDSDAKYNASEVNNLKALYTAMMLYHESEGQWPQGNGWMDAIKNRVATADLAGGEADKKFISPSLAGQPGQYGYAMNDLASGKYKGDIKDKKTPLLFDSSDTSRNAHGDPAKLLPKPPRPGGNVGIAVDGTILKL